MADPAFSGAGQEGGLELWRVENLKVVKQNPTVIGKFFVGDSYILLSTKVFKDGRKEWNIHFWLGKETSQDEMGVAAYKTVELDDSLGGAPKQHREVQEAESPLFLSYFKEKGIEYLPGGTASGFTHVETDKYEPRLLRVKGKRTVRVQEVELSNKSLNTGDVFILDLGLTLYQYNGTHANKMEKAKALQSLCRIKDDQRGGRPTIVFMEQDPNNSEFWEALGGQIEVTDEGHPDEVVEQLQAKELKILNAADLKTFLPVNNGQLKRSQLDEASVMIVDTGSEIFAWTGKSTSLEQRKEAMSKAMEYLASSGRKPTTPIDRVMQGAEPQSFKDLFGRWDLMRKATFASEESQGIAKINDTTTASDVDMELLRQRQHAMDTPVDDGSGKLQVWVIEGKVGKWDKVPVPEEKHGQFYGGDCYILLYTYQVNKRDEYIIYFWQGKDSSTDERAASAIFTMQMDDEMGGFPVQVMVTQGKEPAHFRQLFKGRMVIHSGGKASGFRNRRDSDTIDTDGTALFHVKGTNKLNTCGVQVEEVAAVLNSGDCFVLVLPRKVYSWKGCGASASEQEVANNIANILAADHLGHGGRDVESVEEGKEPEAFWEALGGKMEYAKASLGDEVAQEPRLFRCTNCGGRLSVGEIVDFTQEDLNDGDVFILDVGTSLYVWEGTGANEAEKKFAQEVAPRFLEGRGGKDTPITNVKPGHEPTFFRQHFSAWDPEHFSKQIFLDPYEARRQSLMEDKERKGSMNEAAIERKATLKKTGTTLAGVAEAAATALAAEEPEAVAAPAPAEAEHVELPLGTTFPLDVLQNSTPPGVPPNHKELYLSDADFKTAFGMTKEEFKDLKAWKQADLKKKANIF